MTPGRLALLREHKAHVLQFLAGGHGDDSVAPHPQARFDPFPLTDVQAAYLVGRGDAYPFGGVGCHGYGELRFESLDPDRLEEAWHGVVSRHDMLRAVIQANSSQQVLPETPRYRINVVDVRGRSSASVSDAIQATRMEMDHRVYRPGEWPLFDLRVTQADEFGLLHFSIDFLVADFVSLQLLVEELQQRYLSPTKSLPSLDITFRDFLATERGRKSGARYERDRAYWWQRIDELPGPPELPVARPEHASRQFHRTQMALSADEWRALRVRAAAATITPSCAILAAFAEVVGRWSRQPRFTLDVTVLNRPPVHPQISQLVGDFTSVELLVIDQDPKASFHVRAQAVQAQLWEDLDHALCSGIDVMREVRRRRGEGLALFPIVFTSSVGIETSRADSLEPAAGRLVHGISQTPQVWLDCQVMERDGALTVNWDIRAGVFPDGLIDSMFGAFTNLLRGLAKDDSLWELSCPVPVPQDQSDRRAAVNRVLAPVSDRMLHEELLAQAERTPDRPAVLTSWGSVTYGQLIRVATAVEEALVARGCRQRELVAVVMEKGWEQVAAVVGVLLAGCAYTPVDLNQPPARRELMLANADARVVLTQSWCHEAARGRTSIAVDTLTPRNPSGTHRFRQLNPDDLAYVIYTSGSTGRPKGVMISHRSALNTIADINRRFGVGDDDRVLGLANLGFDLSVYDIFGPLAVGGALVLPDADRRGDPSHWASLIAQHQVTLWNSVPAQLELLGDYLETNADPDLSCLRMALLSGDWIPVRLPNQIRSHLASLQLISLGGATEAAIWSIFYPINHVEEHWRSIPYGTPLANQTFHVLDAHLRSVPDLVPGELYIGGLGLALGYLGDEELTTNRFITHPQTRERLYRTGDLGRYLPDGNIEFLGREDSQIKIRGHRIELAEVEAALLSRPGVSNAAVIAEGIAPNPRRIAAFVETDQRSPDDLTEAPLAAANIAKVAIEEAAPLRETIDEGQLVAYARELDATGLLQMSYALQQQGGLAQGDDAQTLDEILSRGRVAPRHHRLIRRWLNALQSNGMIKRDPTGRYYDAIPVDLRAVQEAWRHVEQLQPDGERRAELINYFKVAAEHLPEMMRGESDPLQLLFPQGRTDIHDVAYNAMSLSRYLNRLLTGCARYIAQPSRESATLRVLEIGAGVGGTSSELIPVLSSYNVEYLFTDVSQFFLNNARQRFREYPWVKFGLFDMNRAYREQGLLPNTFDLVVGANVLHYAKDASRVLQQVRELVVPGGWLLFIEATADTYQIMTSMEFLFDEASGDFQDVRQGHDQTFISCQQWLELLKATGADSWAYLPERDVITDQMAMHVFLARFKADRTRMTRAELTAQLSELLPDYMIPSQIQFIDRLPLTENGKIDRKTLASWLPKDASDPLAGGSEPASDLERRLAQVWSSMLQVQRIARDQSFFELGGDSLLAAQVVTEMREKVSEASRLFFDNLLRLMLEGPTVASLAAHLEAPNLGQEGTPTATIEESPLVPVNRGAKGTARVLVHGASGTLVEYQALIDQLGDNVPLLGLIVRDASSYVAIPPGQLLERVAGTYVRALLAAGFVRLQLVGHGFGAFLATELARQLTEAGVYVEQLFVIDTDPMRWRIHDEMRAPDLIREELGIESEAIRLAPETSTAQVGLAGGGSGDGDASPDSLSGQRVRLPSAGGSSIEFTNGLDGSDRKAMYDVVRHSLEAAAPDELLPYAGDMTLIGLAETPRTTSEQETVDYWTELCIGQLTVVNAEGAAFASSRAAAQAKLVELITAERSAVPN
jgi:pyochelin synthetase